MTIQTRAAALAARLGTTGLIIAGLVLLLVLSLFNTYADIRIPLPLLPDIHYEGWKPRALRDERTIAEFPKAQALALERALAAKAKAEQDYRDLAGRIDDEADQARSGALADAERFIAANRVRPEADRCGSGRAVAAAPNNGARNSEAVREAPELAGTVAVSADDVRTCTVNTLQAEAARAWALQLEAASRPAQ